MKITKQEKDILLQSYKELIVFGAGNAGEMILNFCKKNNITILAFCDNNINKIGTSINNIPVYSVSDIQKKYNDPIFIISPLTIPVQNILEKQLLSLGYKNYYTIFQFIEKITSQIEVKYELNNNIQNVEQFYQEKISVKFIDLSITEKCSLKCKECAHLMQYYEDPKNVDKFDLFKTLDKLDGFFDSIGAIHMLGGEPLMHPDFYEIIEYAQQKENISIIKVLTNGTILPKEENLKNLNKDKLHFTISNYGKFSKNIDALCDMLKRLQISYACLPLEEWIACSTMQYQNHTEEELKHIYEWCGAKYCLMAIDGKLFHCAFLGNIYRLKSIPKDDIEFVDLMIDKDRDIIRSEIRQYLYGNTYFKACNYCKGRTSEEIVGIPVAVQTKLPLPYKKYD